MALPSEDNLAPYVTSAAVAAVAIAALLLVVWLLGGSAEALGSFTAMGVFGAILLGVWASQADSRWKLRGYIWRYAVCWIVATVLSAACGMFPK
jgi:hypothetical protein